MPAETNKWNSLTEKTIDSALIASETSLIFVPKNKFSIYSWSILDKFMDFATDVFTVVVASLLKEGYIKIIKEDVQEFKALGITIFKRTGYLIELSKKPSEHLLTGWFEELLFEQFKYSNSAKLDVIVYRVLNEIFNKKNNLSNPGKTFTLEILKHQKIHLYEFHHKKNWLLNSVTLWYTNGSSTQFKPTILSLTDIKLEQIQITKLRGIISKQLRKFQDSE